MLVLCGLTLAAAEGLVRAWYPAPTRHYVWPPSLRVDFAPTDAATPGVTGRGRFRTNSLGLRSDEPFADARRVVYVLGGSTAADLYLDQEEAWVALVQDGLNRVPGQPRTWVGNLARPSLASVHNLIHFDRLLPELPPADLLVDLVGVNDLQLALKSSYLDAPTPETHLDVGVRPPPAGGRARRAGSPRCAPRASRGGRGGRPASASSRPATRRGTRASGSAGRPRRRRTSSTPCPTSGRPWPSTAGTSWRSPSAPARTARPCCS